MKRDPRYKTLPLEDLEDQLKILNDGGIKELINEVCPFDKLGCVYCIFGGGVHIISCIATSEDIIYKTMEKVEMYLICKII